MAEFEIDVVTPDGKMGSFVAHPDGKGPFPAVILYMDAPGIREELRDFARRIASQGYFSRRSNISDIFRQAISARSFT